MKRFSVLIVLLAACLTDFAQGGANIIPPAAAKSAFERAFPHADKPKWGKEKKDYEVEFTSGGKQLSAVYDETGVLKETEEDIKPTDLPAAVVTYVRGHYPKDNIKEAAKITLPNGTVNYEAEVNKKDLIFDAAGKFVRSQKDVD